VIIVGVASARLWRILAPALAGVSFTFFTVAFVLYGKEPRVVDPGDYVREPVEGYTPALLAYLLRFGVVKPVDMVATMIDLARKGYAHIAETRLPDGSYRYDIQLKEKDEAGLKAHELDVLHVLKLVGAADGISGEHLKEWANLHALDIYRSYSGFRWDMLTDGNSRDFVTTRLPLITANIAIGGLVFLLAIGGLDVQGGGVGFKSSPGPMIAMTLVAVQLALTPLLRRRTRKGAQDYRRWMAFKHFLRDFSTVRDWTPAAVPVWEEFLVYAIPLGVAHAVAKAIDMHAPHLSNGFSWYGFEVEPGRSLGESIGGLAGTFTETAKDAFATKPSRAEIAANGLSPRAPSRAAVARGGLDARAPRARG
jgi:hypothetical protein